MKVCNVMILASMVIILALFFTRPTEFVIFALPEQQAMLDAYNSAQQWSLIQLCAGGAIFLVGLFWRFFLKGK